MPDRLITFANFGLVSSLIMAAWSVATAQAPAPIQRERQIDTTSVRMNEVPYERRAGRLESRRDREVRADSRRPGDEELAAGSNRYNALASRLGYADAAALRDAYDAVADEDVSFGEFIVAHLLARHLTQSGRLSGKEATVRGSILSRLTEGGSIGEVLRGLGLSRSEAKEAERAAKRQLKEGQGR